MPVKWGQASMDEDAKWLQRFEKKFHHYSGEDNLIQLDEFIQVLNIKESFFAERFFEFVDQDKSGSISLKELLTALRLLINGKPTDKLHFLFKVYDVDGNGSIDFEELRTVLRFCMAESALSLSEDILCELTEVLFEDADTDGNGKITFEELRNQLDRYPDIASNLTISAAEWLKPPRRSARGNDNINLYFGKLFKTIRLLSNNLSTVFLLVIFFSINIACGVWGVMDVYTTTPDKPWLMLARFNGRPLNFNCSFILVLMLRKSLTWLRSTRLAAILPVDQHVTLHKLVGIVVVLEAFLHAVGHFGNCADLIIQNTTEYTAWEILFTQASGIGWVAALAFPTEYITVHIRAQGNWTKRIFNFVKKYNNEKVGIRKESQRLEALIEEGSPSGSNTNNLKCTSVVSVLRNENETSIHGTPATVRNIAVLSKDDDRFAVTNFSAKYDTKEDLTSNRSSELYGSSPNGWMKSEIVVDDRKALLSRASSKSGSSSNSNNDLTASSSAARSHGTLPELRGHHPWP
ncbi:putative NADPH oxidase 5-like [Apostichopus japonicus]|uniref:Putative NADPH oxidase 5-like n=1 Tax=Stichopus japonicus TaxID=307972 RepID=A0A2G8K7B3_STIJA|nr:putative NADPH oxidase 5-like [Apostichopus japonicus]